MVRLLSGRNVIVYLQALQYREAEERERQRRLRRLESWTVAQHILARIRRESWRRGDGKRIVG